jgi:hypothetical protein
VKARTLFIGLVAAVLCVGLLAAPALAGKKKKTTVVFNSGSPELKGSNQVKASGSLNTTSACKVGRGMKLFLTDANGAVVATLDGSTSDGNGNWRLQGKLPDPAPDPVRVQVKATKRTVGKAVCKAGLSAVTVAT